MKAVLLLTFAAGVCAGSGIARGQPIYDWMGFRSIQGARVAAFGDVSGDGAPDAALVAPGRLGVMLASGEGEFEPGPEQVIEGTDPRDLALRDLNGDGRLDAVICDGEQNVLHIFDGVGGGAFALRASLDTGETPVAIRIGDVDDDGLLDLAVVNFDHYFIGIYRGLPGGAFADAVRLRVGFRPSTAELTDLDDDGDLDVVALNSGEATVSVLLNRGDGSFEPERLLEIDPAPLDLAVADLGTDRLPELVVAYRGGALVLANTGRGAFAPRQTLSLEDRVAAIDLDDINRDGRPDLIVTTAGGELIEVRLNVGGELLGIPHLRVRAAGVAIAVELFDVNGDALSDAIIATDRHLRVGLGDKAGIRTSVPAYDNRTLDLDLADLTGDGVPDLIVADYPEAVFLRGLGEGRFELVSVHEPWGENIRAAPLRPGGGPDVIGIDRASDSLAVLRNDDGRLVTHEMWPTLGDASDLAAADIDLDGFTDVAIAGARTTGGLWVGEVGIHFNRGDGGFDPLVKLPLSRPARSIAVGDVSGDSIPDLIVTARDLPPGQDPLVIVRLGLGAGTFGPEQVIPGVGIYAGSVRLFDLGSDGLLDILTLDARWALAAHRNLGAGRFGPAEVIALPAEPTALAVADVTGGGRLELLVGLTRGDTVLLQHDAAGVLQAVASFAPVMPRADAMAAVDLNADGRPDLVCGGLEGIETFAHRGGGVPPCPADLDGDGRLTFFDFIEFQSLFAASDPRADFDRDGTLDIFDFLAFQTSYALGCA